MTEVEELNNRIAALNTTIDGLLKYIEEIQRENGFLMAENLKFMKQLSGNGKAVK